MGSVDFAKEIGFEYERDESEGFKVEVWQIFARSLREVNKLLNCKK
jgi:hypothetical protein